MLSYAAGRTQGGEQLVGHQHGVGRLGYLGEQDKELVTTVTADRILVADQRRKTMRREPEHLIAHGMAQRVVYLLEIIEVQEQQGHPRAMTLREGDGTGEAIE